MNYNFRLNQNILDLVHLTCSQHENSANGEIFMQSSLQIYESR